MSITELEDILCYIRWNHYACGFSEADHLKVASVQKNNYDIFIYIANPQTDEWRIFAVSKMREELHKLREEN